MAAYVGDNLNSAAFFVAGSKIDMTIRNSTVPTARAEDVVDATVAREVQAAATRAANAHYAKEVAPPTVASLEERVAQLEARITELELRRPTFSG